MESTYFCLLENCNSEVCFYFCTQKCQRHQQGYKVIYITLEKIQLRPFFQITIILDAIYMVIKENTIAVELKLGQR